MAAIDDAIKKCDEAMKLASELEQNVSQSMLHQRLIGILLGILIVAAVWAVAQF